MENLILTLVIGLTLSGLHLLVCDIRRTEEKFRCHRDFEPDYWYLGRDEGGHDGCGTVDTGEWSNWDWLELLDAG